MNKYYLSWSFIFNLIPRKCPWVVKCEGEKDTWIFRTEEEARKWIKDRNDGVLMQVSTCELETWKKHQAKMEKSQ